ncbi:ligase-associated DNA damage response DEXH box helicase [Marinigracilibium pacificum]|uniref:Ligase-associated DNA damage response DEXH box helicase n=1 Tax=Marinigracilibium pacificum TaxID=2729599 RepID=A0A848IS71_9BACT|nr:ligase-associated DNA damage response DEXH box helicase [Marinigracilibium pacificum]NMM47197.1 ligase-associated DNA damage response DEXH box helicase [Marinigracilibium pacificum]
MNSAFQRAQNWFDNNGWQVFDFQRNAWNAIYSGKSGIINAPTGSGKTYSAAVPILSLWKEQKNKKQKGVFAIWITPIRALTVEIKQAVERLATGMDINDFNVAIRSGDTSTKERQAINRKPPQLLITTPESLHLLLSQKNNHKFFSTLRVFIADEWHELLGSKRAVLTELALSRFKYLTDEKLSIWGISATIGNMDQAMDVLLGPDFPSEEKTLIRSNLKKNIIVETILPDNVEELPWSGHLGIKMLEKVLPVIRNSRSTLIFTNTRAQSEIWYQKIISAAPDLLGLVAMHHGSIDRDLRTWVEEAIHNEKLKAVVCTSSLDLGVDFRPVETVIQIGGPKGVARFIQRAGRSGHRPGETAKIYFVPTHSLELLEAAALRTAIKNEIVEDRLPYIRSFDVLVQYLVTLAVGGGFNQNEVFQQVLSTYSFTDITKDEWLWALSFITTGGNSLTAYDDYKKVEVEDGLYVVKSRRVAMRHRMSIGTIVSDSSMTIKYNSGKRIGSIEEWFIASLNPGDTFWFAGNSLELIRVKYMIAYVRKSNKKSGKVPSWQGGRIPLSSQVSGLLREKVSQYPEFKEKFSETTRIKPLLDIQNERSIVPECNQLLMEYFRSKEGYHLFVYPFEGRLVHEGIAGLFAYRMSLLEPISFSIAMNDYGFELLSDKPIPVNEALDNDFLSTHRLIEDIQAGVNANEMARRKFRDIASIAGLVFKGFPGQNISGKHLQSSSQLVFDVFKEYDPDNLLLNQSYNEVLEFQLEEYRLRQALERIEKQEIIVKNIQKITPFAFPIMVDRTREKVSSEKLEDRIAKMKIELEKD